MSRAAPMLALAGLLAATALGLWLWTGDTMQRVLLPSAVLIALLMAGGAALARGRPELRVRDTAASAPLLAAGIAGVALGAAVGAWASLMGAGVLLLALVAALGERRG